MEITLLARLDELSRNVDRLRNDVIRSGKMPSKQATTMGDMFQRVFSVSAFIDTLVEENLRHSYRRRRLKTTSMRRLRHPQWIISGTFSAFYLISSPRPQEAEVLARAIISAALNASLALFGSMAGGIIGSWIQASIQKRAEAAMKLVEERAKAAAEMAANAVAQRVESAAEEVRDTAVKMKTEMKGRNAQDVEGIVEGAVEGTIIGLAKGVEEANMHASSSTEGGTLIGESIQAKG